MIDRVVLLNDDSQVRGGAAHVVMRQANLLADRGVPVTLVVGDAGIAPEFDRPEVKIVPLGAHRLRDAPKVQAAVQGVWHEKARRTVVDLIARHDTPSTVYHIHNWQTILSPATFAALRPVASRTWLHAHDYFLCCPNGAYFNFVAKSACPLVPMSSRCAITHCDRVSRTEKAWRLVRQMAFVQAMNRWEGHAGIMLVHNALREPFERSGWLADSLHVVPNPVSCAPQQRVAAETNDDLLFVGRLESVKGIEELLSACRAVGERIEVAGDGELRAALAAEYPEARMLGWLDRAGLTRALAKARMLVVPSLVSETFGLALLEALQAGVPVMVSRSAALADAIVDAGAGVVCDPHSPDRLAGQLRAARLLPSAEIRRMSVAARELAGRLASTETQWIDVILGLYAGTVPFEGATAERRGV